MRYREFPSQRGLAAEAVLRARVVQEAEVVEFAAQGA